MKIVYAKKFREYIENKGGVLLTQYFNAKTKVTILCERGHEWTTTPDSIYSGNWCSVCSGNKKDTSVIFRKIGERFGCTLISDYKNARTAIWYRCSKGHEFKKSPYWLKKDYEKIEILCPVCKKEI
ncbi:MAG: hypothetical protein GF353_21655 [Candidatus Lokiarchaeota archaeon]|nr:hypothetical protein [Candidatus Lokiarchaeota archaeon]